MAMFQPHYVTRAVQRAYGIEHPIGDPFGGAAYGEKNGGGSFGKIISSAIPMITGAAMMIGSGGALAPLVIGGAMFAGGAMSGIGAISGNQTLSKIGGITSAVAGVGALGYSVYSNWDSISNFFAEGVQSSEALSGAAGAGGEYAMFGGDTAPLTSSSSVATDIVNTPTTAAFQGGGYNAEQFAGELQNQMNLASNTPLNMQTANSFAGPVTAPINTSAGANAVANTGIGSVTLPGGGDYGVTTASGQVLNSSGQVLGTAPGFQSSTLPTVFGSAGGGGGGGAGGLLSSVGSFIKENPVVSLMGLQTLSGLAEGASPKSQAEGEYIQAMTAMKQAEQEYLEAAKAPETAANTAYLLEKAKEFDKTKAYEEEKRAAYNASIAALQTPQTQNLAQTMYGGAQAGLINQARA